MSIMAEIIPIILYDHRSFQQLLHPKHIIPNIIRHPIINIRRPKLKTQINKWVNEKMLNQSIKFNSFRFRWYSIRK